MGGHSKRYPVLRVLEIDIPVTTDAYSAGDQIGDSAIEIPMARHLEDQDSLVIDTAILIDNAGQCAEVDLVFFDDEPVIAGSDNEPANIATSELDDRLIGQIRLPNGLFVSFAGSSNAAVTVKNVGMEMELTTNGRSIWVLLVLRQDATYGATTDLRLKLGIREQ